MTQMNFDREKLIELHRRYAENESRGSELVKICREELNEIGDRKPTAAELSELAAHEFQTAKAAGFKEAIEELFFIHDGTFEVK